MGIVVEKWGSGAATLFSGNVETTASKVWHGGRALIVDHDVKKMRDLMSQRPTHEHRFDTVYTESLV